MKKNKFPLPHLVKEDKKEVWIVCRSSVTAKGIPTLMDQHFPEYTACLCSPDVLEELKNQC